jgi:hypothetical protein
VDVLVAQEDKKPVKLVTIQKQFQFAGDVILLVCSLATFLPNA